MRGLTDRAPPVPLRSLLATILVVSDGNWCPGQPCPPGGGYYQVRDHDGNVTAGGDCTNPTASSDTPAPKVIPADPVAPVVAPAQPIPPVVTPVEPMPEQTSGDQPSDFSQSPSAQIHQFEKSPTDPSSFIQLFRSPAFHHCLRSVDLSPVFSWLARFAPTGVRAVFCAQRFVANPPPPSAYPADINAVTPAEPVRPIAVHNLDHEAPRANLDDDGIEDLQFPSDTSPTHNNLVLSGVENALLALVPRETDEAGCSAALDALGELDFHDKAITISRHPLDEELRRGDTGSWVCVRTNEGNVVLLQIGEVIPAVDEEGHGQSVVITVFKVWRR
jgi:hypothetical protein